jgi:hypothetical protein
MAPTKLVRFWLLIAIIPALSAAQPVPQTARQALIEMFFSPTPGTLQKHLPDAMLAAMKKANLGSGSSTPDTFALLTSQLASHGQFQTYEAGPVLFSAENPHDNSKFEIVVERDDLQADEDDIEVSFRAYKDGQPQLAGLSPRFTFGMQQETGVWKLNEITFAFKVSLTDPEFLKNLSKWQPPATSVSAHPDTSAQASARNFNEASTIIAMRTIVRAEVKYAAAYGHGYTCSLSDLGGIGADEVDDHRARLIDPGLAGGKKYGYRFALAGCGGSSSFILTAVPAEGSGGQHFCTDESAVVRTSSDGNGASCLTGGKPVP